MGDTPPLTTLEELMQALLDDAAIEGLPGLPDSEDPLPVPADNGKCNAYELILLQHFS